MKFVLALFLFGCVVTAQELHPLDFDWRSLKDISEAPHLRNIAPQNSSSYADSASRIVGGSVATLTQFPFHVTLIINSNWLCGGSLLNPNWVLTAAHCLEIEEGVSNINVYSKVDFNEGYYWMTTGSLFVIHGGYDAANYYQNDISMIRLATPASVTIYSDFISLPRNNVGNTFVGYVATVAGFGRYSDASQDTSPVKRFVTIPVITNSECASTFPVSENQICYSTVGGRGACNGDSGGAVFVGDVNVHSSARQIVGIVSFGDAAGCELGYPKVNTRVTNYISWIDNIIATYS